MAPKPKQVLLPLLLLLLLPGPLLGRNEHSPATSTWFSLRQLRSAFFNAFAPPAPAHACHSDEDCATRMARSKCDKASGTCKCGRNTYSYKNSECLSGRLLGQPCLLDAQCQGRVGQSLCVRGSCACQRGTIAFRRHTCVEGAKVREICYSDAQCRLKDADSFCKFILRGVFGRCHCLYGHEGQDENKCKVKFDALDSACFLPGPCYGIPHSSCVPTGPVGSAARCKCDPGFVPEDGRTCSRTEVANSDGVASRENVLLASITRLQTAASVTSATSLSQPCSSDAECRAADAGAVCHGGICTCAAFVPGGGGDPDSSGFLTPRPPPPRRLRRVSRSAEDWWFCTPGRVRLCPKGTFQCRSSGRCISRYFLCDGRAHCSDGSDEQCSDPERCPKGSFPCQESGKCVSASRVCNGVMDCERGEDEWGCKPVNSTIPLSCPNTSFACADGSGCVPGFEFCNAKPACPDGSDETAGVCGPVGRCADGGRCRAVDTVCSGKDGCGDGSDERMCQICKCPVV